MHHDCEVKLSIGQETVLLGIPSLTSKQLRRCRNPPLVDLAAVLLLVSISCSANRSP